MFILSGVTGLKVGQVRFQDFWAHFWAHEIQSQIKKHNLWKL